MPITARILAVFSAPAARFLPTLALLFLLGNGLPASFAAPQAIATVSFARGSTAAQQQGQAPRLLGNGSAIYQGDNIQTAERSFVIIKFIDGAKVTVRPNSSFSIDSYQARAANPQARLALHEGGMRVENEGMAQEHPENFQIQTEFATVKAQQADYSVRLCQHEDCQQEQNFFPDQAEPADKTTTSVVARVADLQGEVYAANPADANGKPRRLSVGAPLYSEDRLTSRDHSFALLVFRDGEKITVQANSELAIADYHYQQPDKPDHALYRLTTGGMRVLTGAIGKTNKQAFAVDTPVGTIGIRGTGFDLSCVGSCVNPQATGQPPDALLQQGAAPGLYSHVWQGQIVLINNAGEFLLTVPDSHYTASRDSKALVLRGIPELLLQNPFPRPDLTNADLSRLFGASNRKDVPAGLYVAVHRGHVQLDKTAGISGGNKIDLGANEAGHAGASHELTRLETEEKFQRHDPYLSGDNAPKIETQGIYTELTDDGPSPGDDNYQCATP